MKIVLLSLLAAMVLAQQSGQKKIVIDDLHGFRTEYDSQKDLVLFVSETRCYVILTLDKDWNKYITNIEDLYLISDMIYAKIQDNRDIITLTKEQAFEEYSSNLERWQCRDKNVFKLLYNPEI